MDRHAGDELRVLAREAQHVAVGHVQRRKVRSGHAVGVDGVVQRKQHELAARIHRLVQPEQAGHVVGVRRLLVLDADPGPIEIELEPLDRVPRAPQIGVDPTARLLAPDSDGVDVRVPQPRSIDAGEAPRNEALRLRRERARRTRAQQARQAEAPGDQGGNDAASRQGQPGAARDPARRRRAAHRSDHRRPATA